MQRPVPLLLRVTILPTKIVVFGVIILIPPSIAMHYMVLLAKPNTVYPTIWDAVEFIIRETAVLVHAGDILKYIKIY